MLDVWFRDLCSSYRSLRDAERQLVREFLVFDMTSRVDIAVQDRLALGFVEANRSAVVGELGAAAAALKFANPEEFETKSEGGRRRASMLSLGGAASNTLNETQSENAVDSRIIAVQGSQLSNKLNTETRLPNRSLRRASSYDTGFNSSTAPSSPSQGGTPLIRAYSNGDSPATGVSPTKNTPKRRTSYAVSVPNAEVPKYMAPKDMPPIDDSNESSSSMSGPKSGERPMLLSSAKESTDRSESFSDDNRESGLEEKLLKIGMSGKSKKKSGGCCVIS